MLTFTYHIADKRWSMKYSGSPHTHFDSDFDALAVRARQNNWLGEGVTRTTDHEGVNRLLCEVLTARKRLDEAVAALHAAQTGAAGVVKAHGIKIADIAHLLDAYPRDIRRMLEWVTDNVARVRSIAT